MSTKNKQTALGHQTVDEYISAQTAVVQASLEKLRKAIKSAAPEAVEVISYRIPTYKFRGPLVHFAVHKDHCSFIVTDKTLIKKFKKELTGFKTSGTTIHFTPDNPLPSSLIKKIVKSRIEGNFQNVPVKKIRSNK